MTPAPLFPKRALSWTLGLILLGVLVPQVGMWWATRGLIHTSLPPEKKQTALILGASVHGDSLSGALLSRMETALNLYRQGFVNDILLSGDGQDPTYDETKAMLKYALRQGVPAQAIRTDSQGLSTFSSLHRARALHGLQSAYIVSQPFHLQRAVWIARALGMEAQGVCAAPIGNVWFYETREFGAKIKDFYGSLWAFAGGTAPGDTQ